MNVIKVGMADLKAGRVPDRIRTNGLGSCVGVVLYDPQGKVAGMAHVMLPSSSLNKGSVNKAKYADTAIPWLIEEMESLGAKRSRLKAKIAGGAQMFHVPQASQVMRIGPRNVDECKAILQELAIPLLHEETGGNFGRTIEIDSETGILMIRTVSQGVKEV